MPEPFRIVTTPAFERDVRRRLKGAPDLIGTLEEVRAVLRADPHNRSGKHNIKKLTGVKKGEG